MKLPVEVLQPEKFTSFGTIIEQPSRTADGGGSGWQWWHELAQLAGGDRPYAIGCLNLQPSPLRFGWAERHMLSDELIVPLGEECLVYVAPNQYPDEPGKLPPLEDFRVFRLRRGQAVLLKPGVWHGAPLAIDAPLNALVVLLHNTGKQDTYIVRFEDQAIEILGG